MDFSVLQLADDRVDVAPWLIMQEQAEAEEWWNPRNLLPGSIFSGLCADPVRI